MPALAAPLLVAAALAIVAVTPAAAKQSPSTYIVSQDPGILPEGIAVVGDGTMYVTSLGTGAVYRGSVHDPDLRLFLPAGEDGRTQATGIHLDRRGRIFVAGYATGKLFVYDAAGQLLAIRTAPDPNAALNDLTFADGAVFVTDSATQTVWRASLDGDGIGPLQAFVTADAFAPAPGFLNGIVTTPGGRALLVTDQGTDTLHRVDLDSGKAVAVPIAGGPMGADGLLLEDHWLYGVVNFVDASGEVAVVVRLVRLNAGYTAGQKVADSGAAGLADTPTTLARDRDRLLWVNSQLGVAPGTPPYTVTQVPPFEDGAPRGAHLSDLGGAAR
jgi:hypothetical protein